MHPKENYPVIVQWHDASTMWDVTMTSAEAKKQKQTILSTCGFFIGTNIDDDEIIIASEWDSHEKNWRHFNYIPKAGIKKIVELREMASHSMAVADHCSATNDPAKERIDILVAEDHLDRRPEMLPGLQTSWEDK